MNSGHIPNQYDIPEHGIWCEVVYTGDLGTARRAIGHIAQAYGWHLGARVLRVMAAHEAPPIEMVPSDRRDYLCGVGGVYTQRWLVWYDERRGTAGREEHGALVDALIADHGIAGEVAA